MYKKISLLSQRGHSQGSGRIGPNGQKIGSQIGGSHSVRVKLILYKITKVIIKNT